MKSEAEEKEFEDKFTNIAKQSGISFFGRVVHRGFSFITGVLLARWLGPNVLGQFSLAKTITNFMTNFTKVGMDRGLIRYISKFREEGEEGKVKSVIIFSFAISIVLSILFGIIFYLNSSFFAVTFFNDPAMAPALKYVSIYLVVFTLFRLSGAVLKGNKRVDLLTYISNLFIPIFYLILLFLVYYMQNKLFGVFFARALSQFLGIGLIVFCTIKYIFPSIKHIKCEMFDFSNYFKFSIPLLFIGLLYYLISNIDKLMLGYFSTSDQVGIYTVSSKIAVLAIFILQAVNNIFAPIISELVEKKSFFTLEKLLKSTTKWIFCFSINFLGFVFVFRYDILKIFGEEYVYAGSVLVVLTFAQFVNAAVGSTGMVLVMSGNQRYETYNSIGVCVLNIILNIILIPKYGVLGAGIATATAIFAINILKLIEVYNIFKFHPYYLEYYKVIVSFLISLFVIYFISLSNVYYFVRLILSVIALSGVNFGILYYLGFEKEDIFIFKKIINKFS
ncbi:MAG: flippase [Halanaerobium sp.]